MDRTCLKCGAVNAAATGEFSEACPKCGAIYSKVEALARLRAEQASAAAAKAQPPALPAPAPVAPTATVPPPAAQPPPAPVPLTAPASKTVGLPLGLGIFVFPYLFTWLTLQKGYSTAARAVSFAWLTVYCLTVFNGMQEAKRRHAEAPTVASSASGAPAVPPRATPRAAPDPKPAAPSGPPIAMPIDLILGAYKENEIGADARYKGHIVLTTGFVIDVKKDILSHMYVTLGTGKEFERPHLQAYFDDSMGPRLANLRQGDSVTVACQVDGLMFNVLMKNCEIR